MIAQKPATLGLPFDPRLLDPGFIRSAYVRLCADSERSVTSGQPAKNITYHERTIGELLRRMGFCHISAPRHRGQGPVQIEGFKKTLPSEWARLRRSSTRSSFTSHLRGYTTLSSYCALPPGVFAVPGAVRQN